MTARAAAPRHEIALFGGSFNPPHVAHVMAVAYVLATEPVERLLVVPTFRHPFQKALLPFEERLTLCELAFEGVSRVEVSGLERDLGGDSYTVRTLEALACSHEGVGLALCVGADVLAERHQWHRAEDIEKLARLIVIGRQGFPSPPGASPPLPAVSSTEIRQRVATGQDVSRLLPRSVAARIASRGLYRA